METGEYDLEGLFVRLGYAIDRVRSEARRPRYDRIDLVPRSVTRIILRSELRRLFRFLKDKGVTAVVTGEKGDGTFTRNGLEEYRLGRGHLVGQ